MSELHQSSPTPPPLSSRTSSVSLTDTAIHHGIVITDPSTSTPTLPLLPPKPISTAPNPNPKPRSSKPRLPRSPSPSPPPPPPPLQTIRLKIALGGPDSYEVDIASIARATGQRPPTPVRVKRDTSESEGDDEGDKPKPKRKKKNLTSEYYDLTDNFIDDSELAVDERTYFGQTKQQGFYVSSGEVALVKDKSPKKPKSKRLHDPGISTHLPTSTSSSSNAAAGIQEGTRDAPIALTSDGEEERDEDGAVGRKRKRYITIVEGGKKRKIIDVHSFHPELQIAIDVLKEAISKESWETKGKFPPAIKPLLAEVAVKAIVLQEYDEHFFNLMPVLFPYNKFTMSKLIKRTVFHEHTQILTQRQDVLLIELAVLTAAGFTRAREEWEKSVVLWEKRQERVKAEADLSPCPDALGLNNTLVGADTVRHVAEDAGSGSGVEQDHWSGVDGAAGGGPTAGKDREGKDGGGKEGKDKDKDGTGKDPLPPTRKYRMTEEMKGVLWQLVMLSNDVCRLENEKNALEGSTVQVSEQGLRKILYQKIVAAFPEGWMSSGQISREVSSMKKKYEKEAMENEL